ncbi:MAG: Lrp/AsnC family transcriptional regulator, partial [Solirubrobacterales bacterium]
MASRELAAKPKVRARKDGAAVPLSDRDRELLNLMQGSFPIAERPYAEVAAELGVTEEEVLADVQRLLDDRIIRQVTPIYDTRAFGYGSMLVAAKVDPEHPWRAAKIVNSHPGVSHNYLRNHDFNMWFTIAVEEDSKLGLQGTLDVLQEKTGAESIRQLPTLKLFKIRMDLEMQGDTDSLASQGKVEEAVELERQSYDQFDRDVVVATQGNLPVVPEPWAPAAEQLGIPVDDLLAHLRGMQERGLLRRVAGILFHRRAGFSANGMGVWRVPEDQIDEIGPQMAAFRGISHCYQRPTYEDWPYQVFTMAHGRSKEECDAILDAI